MKKLIAGLAGLLIMLQPFAASGQSSRKKGKSAKPAATAPDTSKVAATVTRHSLIQKAPTTVSTGGTTPKDSSPTGSSSEAQTAAKKRAEKIGESRWNPLSVTTFARSVYDSNIRHDQNNLESYGLIGGAAARYQSRRIRAPLAATYAVARHSYTQGSEWDRVSQDLNVVAGRRLTPRVTLETLGEIALKGSSEDRDIGDQYIFLPRLSYRLKASQRLRGYGAYRIKRYDVASDRNAVNRYAGLEFRQNVGKGGQLETEYRYETNSAEGERQSYTRRTYDAQYAANLSGHNQIIGELKYRTQRYDKRAIVVDGLARPRMDHRFQPSLGMTHLLNRRVELEVKYEFENRTSNDPRRGYRDHLVSVSTQYRW